MSFANLSVFFHRLFLYLIQLIFLIYFSLFRLKGDETLYIVSYSFSNDLFFLAVFTSYYYLLFVQDFEYSSILIKF